VCVCVCVSVCVCVCVCYKPPLTMFTPWSLFISNPRLWLLFGCFIIKPKDSVAPQLLPLLLLAGPLL